MTARAAFVFLLAASPLLAAPDVAKPQEALETAIPHGIKLLEDKKYADFLASYGPPIFGKLPEKEREKVVKDFGEKGAANLLKALKQIKGTRPELSGAGKTAKFKLKEKIGGRDSMTWTKDEKGWRIK